MPIQLRLVLTALFWAGSFTAGRIVAPSLSPSVAAASRYGIAVTLLLAITWRTEGHIPKLTSQQLVTTFFLGLFGIFLYNISFFIALTHMDAGRTALFAALNPVITAVLCAIFLKEHLPARSWLGIAIALCGATVVATRGDIALLYRNAHSVFGAGEIAMLCASTCWAIYTVVGRQALKVLTPTVSTTYAALWGFLMLTVAAFIQSQSSGSVTLTWPVAGALLYLGVFGTVIAFVWYYMGVKTIGPSRTAVFNNLVPVFGVALATILLGEPLLLSMVIGGSLVVMGIVLMNRR